MQLEVVTTKKEFQQLRDEWIELTEEPLQSFDWNYSWWECLGQSFELRIYCLRNSQKLVGIAPFFVDKWFAQRRLRFIGSGATCTDYAKVIGLPEFESAFVREISADVVADKSLSLVELEGLAGEAANSALGSELESNKYWRYDTDLEPTWILNIPAKWEEFVRLSKKSLRRKINKAIRRLTEGEVTVRTWPGEMEFEIAFEVLVDLHQERFISKGERGVFADERFREFLSSATKSLGDKQNAEILVAYSNDEPVGVQLYLVGPDGPQLYQSGARSSALNLEPGHLLFTFAVKRAIGRGFPVFDFLRGNEPYKPYWGAVPRPICRTRCVSKRFLPTVINRVYIKLRALKNTVKGNRQNIA